MKPVVLDMMKFKLVFILMILGGYFTSAQNKYEREYRIRKSQFPENALSYIDEKLDGAKRIKFYKETDSAKTSFEAKFKKDRLWYSVEFDEQGILEDVEILIKPIDVPDDTFKKINDYLNQNFTKYSIRRLQQQYPVSEEEDVEKTIKNAFQNLLLPSINYELMVAGKKEKGYLSFEVLFDAEGNLKQIRQSLPPNYDHVLY